jgi:hypothetical protein
MSFLNDCFNTMLEYGEAIKSSFVKGHVSDWPEKSVEGPSKAPEKEQPEVEDDVQQEPTGSGEAIVEEDEVEL